MTTVSIIYHSGFGHTARAAESVAEGARSVAGSDVELLRIAPEQLADGRWRDDAVLATLAASDAIVFGAPTYMGMVSAPFKAFADATAPMWFDRSWRDKIAGGFTSSGYPSGDKVMTLHYLVTLAGQLRMIWVGPAEMPSNVTGDDRDLDRWGYYLGVGVVGDQRDEESPGAGDLRTARAYGERIARAAQRWTRGRA